jgi:hypothetical protein
VIADLFIPIALLLLPYCVLKASGQYQHTIFGALGCFSLSALVLFLLLKFDNGLDAPDGAFGARILAPYFLLSVPLAIATLGVVGWARSFKDRK